MLKGLFIALCVGMVLMGCAAAPKQALTDEQIAQRREDFDYPKRAPFYCPAMAACAAPPSLARDLGEADALVILRVDGGPDLKRAEGTGYGAGIVYLVERFRVTIEEIIWVQPGYKGESRVLPRIGGGHLIGKTPSYEEQIPPFRQGMRFAALVTSTRGWTTDGTTLFVNDWLCYYLTQDGYILSAFSAQDGEPELSGMTLGTFKQYVKDLMQPLEVHTPQEDFRPEIMHAWEGW